MAFGPFSAKVHIVITTLGLEFAVAVGLGVCGGFFIDKYFFTKPWGMIAGVFVGFGLGMYIIVKEAYRLNQPGKHSKGNQKDGSI